jgi:hypothetical protein
MRLKAGGKVHMKDSIFHHRVICAPRSLSPTIMFSSFEIESARSWSKYLKSKQPSGRRRHHAAPTIRTDLLAVLSPQLVKQMIDWSGENCIVLDSRYNKKCIGNVVVCRRYLACLCSISLSKLMSSYL